MMGAITGSATESSAVPDPAASLGAVEPDAAAESAESTEATGAGVVVTGVVAPGADTDAAVDTGLSVCDLVSLVLRWPCAMLSHNNCSHSTQVKTAACCSSHKSHMSIAI